MIPRITHQNALDKTYLEYLAALEQAGFRGDIETQYASRLAVATDNSVYQLLPQAVVLPMDQDDVALALKVASQDAFKAVTFSPRGGGTGTNGQSLTDGIVLDLSRHMNRILELNLEQGWVRVETGVIKDQLNDYLRPHGYFFSPDLSTSNRATIGGMINTDASGQGSLVYGKTSNHVLGLSSVMMDGSLLQAAPVSLAEAEQQSAGDSVAAKVMAQVVATCRDKAQQISDKFPPLNRFLTGYDLKHVYDEAAEQVDLSRILCGSEGSLAVITEAKLNLTAIPKLRSLVNVKYDSFESALRNAPFLVEAHALSVETVDSRVLNLAKQDIVWHSVSDLLQEVPGKEMQGINIVEFAGNDDAEQHAKIGSLVERLDQLIESGEAGVIGYQICDDLASLQRIYAMRKKAVGLLGAAKGSKKPLAFAEDTCVPPENLADFIMEFRDLLDAHKLDYGMFGHVDAGVLHVRPALDMCDPQQEVLLRKISDQVVALVAKYRGLMWGEHGKGFRSEYGPEFFGEELFTELRKIKGAFDPLNRLNPGKICTPIDSDAELVSVDGVKRGSYDRQIPIQVRDSYKLAMDCNGNGLCFDYDVNSPMCPSMKVRSDRRHSPKGRAGIMREWLRLVEKQGVDLLQMEQDTLDTGIKVKDVIDRIRNTWNKRNSHGDFSDEVMEAMQGCLACKACSSQCPIKVDVPHFRSRFFNLYYTRYLRPARDYLVGNIEAALPLMAKAPGLFNFFLKQDWIQRLTAKTVGFVDAPLLSEPTLKQRLSGHSALGHDLDSLKALSESERAKLVLVVQDPFTSYYEADVVNDLISFIEKLGFQPVLLPFKPNGKAQHVKGFLRAFAKTAENTAAFLRELDQLGLPMVGVDPALVLCYRDEYKHAIGEEKANFKVQLLQEWLLPQLDAIPQASENRDKRFRLFAHCTEKTALPTTHKDWQSLFSHFGGELLIESVGCCGMAGTYGHEAKNLEYSRGIYELSWGPKLAPTQEAEGAEERAEALVTGYSCRSQVKRFEGTKPKHPVQALLELVS